MDKIICEVCGERGATHLEYTEENSWLFTCEMCTFSPKFSYAIRAELLDDPVYGWLDHLSRKCWFPETAPDFIKRLNRYRKWHPELSLLIDILEDSKELTSVELAKRILGAGYEKADITEIKKEA